MKSEKMKRKEKEMNLFWAAVDECIMGLGARRFSFSSFYQIL